MSEMEFSGFFCSHILWEFSETSQPHEKRYSEEHKSENEVRSENREEQEKSPTHLTWEFCDHSGCV
jgi:hypothetical protein